MPEYHPVLPLVAGLLLLGLAIWLLRKRQSQAGDGEGMAERLRAWTEAGCPACVLVGAFEPASAHRGKKLRANAGSSGSAKQAA